MALRAAGHLCRAGWLVSIALAMVIMTAMPALAAAPEADAAGQCSDAQRALLPTLAALPANSWWLASRNRFDSVWTPPALRPLNNGAMTTPASLITAWGGFAWDTRRSALWLFGGGHADYSGNEVYVWYAGDGRWQRASLPSEIKREKFAIDTAIDGVDNAPAAAHSYDNNIYLPRLDRLLSFGGAAYNNGGAWRRLDADGKARRTGPYLFDVTRADGDKVGGTTGSHVQRVAPYPDIVGAQLWQNRDSYEHAGAGMAPDNHVSGCTAYADEDNEDVVYVVAIRGGGTAQYLFRYRLAALAAPAEDNWQLVGDFSQSPPLESSCGYDPVGKFLVRTGSHGKPFVVWSLQQPGPDNPEQIVTPADPAGQFLPLLKSRKLDLSRCGLDFDRQRGHFLLWCGGALLWSLHGPEVSTAATDAAVRTPWRIQRLPLPAEPHPDPQVGNGVLGKWSYAAELDVFVALQNGRAGNVWFYKPDSWQAPVQCR